MVHLNSVPNIRLELLRVDDGLVGLGPRDLEPGVEAAPVCRALHQVVAEYRYDLLNLEGKKVLRDVHNKITFHFRVFVKYLLPT